MVYVLSLANNCVVGGMPMKNDVFSHDAKSARGRGTVPYVLDGSGLTVTITNKGGLLS